MVSAIFTYTLPVLQVVCHLVNTGNSTTGEIIAGVLSPVQNLAVTDSSSDVETTTVPARTLPPGYVAHPDFGVAYKVTNDTATWYVANARCAQEGANLGVLDSFVKIELVKRQQSARNSGLHVGIQMMDGNSSVWWSVKTGLPIQNIPWEQGEPNGGGLCAAIYGSSIGLGRWSCTNVWHYVCEIAYP